MKEFRNETRMNNQGAKTGRGLERKQVERPNSARQDGGGRANWRLGNKAYL